MSKIQVNVDNLKNFADIIGDIEDQCDDALRHLNWDFNSFLADLPGVSPKRVKEVEEIYRNVIKKYQAKLDHAQQLVKRTEAAMRQAEKNLGDKAGEFGLEMLGYYDVQRVFGEYDPITGEKVSGVDRLFATGMLALSLYPPGKAVGVTGKVAIKGANAGTKTSTKFGISFLAKSPLALQSLKNVVNSGKVLEVFKGVYKQVVDAPLAATKLWLERTVRQLDDFKMPDSGMQPATAMGPMPTNTVMDAVGEAKDAFVKMVKGVGVNLGNGKGNYVPEPIEVVTKGTGNRKGVNETNIKNIDDFIKGNKKFDEVIEDYAKVYKENVDLNKPWSWDDTIPGGDSLSSAQKRKIKEMAVEKGHIPEIKVTKVDSMRYGFADFASVAEETVQLPEKFWDLSDKEQFKWLDEQIGGTRKGMTWHHTGVPGKMELVPFGIHNITPHNGGRTKGMWADAPR